MSAFFANPHGIYLAHWWNEIGRLLNVIDQFKVEFFVEIGMLHGGLSAILLSSVEYRTELSYLGIELDSVYVDARVRATVASLGPRASILDADAWKNTTVLKVSDTLRQRGRTLIYCDGGDKPRELHLYWPILRPGDLIACHDYSERDDVTREVTPDDVRDLLAVGRRCYEEELRDTRILLVEKT